MILRVRIFIVLMAFVLASFAVQAQTQDIDEDFAQAVKEWTTRPEFMSPLIDHLPVSSTVPSPKKILGEHIGKPNILHYSEEIFRDFKALEGNSPRVKMMSIGKTEEGKDIFAKAKPIYHVTGGLHATETGSPEMLTDAVGRLYAVDSDAHAEVLLRFQGKQESLLSGEFIGIEETANRPAIIKVQVGEGNIVLFVTNPMFRHQNIGEYRLLFNAILNYKGKHMGNHRTYSANGERGNYD